MNLLDDFRDAKECPMLPHDKLATFYQSIKLRNVPPEYNVVGRVSIITSKLPGLGKSTIIRKFIASKDKVYVRLPLYGDQSPTLLIKLLHSKIEKSGPNFALHLDVNPMSSESLHKLLF